MNPDPLTLQVENPCPFFPSAKNISGENYFCKSCHKTIIDFRGKSTEEIACAVKPGICGIFTADQLPGQSRMGWLRRFGFSFLTLLSFLGWGVKPLTAQRADTSGIRPDTALLDRTIPGKSPGDTSAVVLKDHTKEKKKFIRRKKKYRVVGTPSF